MRGWGRREEPKKLSSIAPVIKSARARKHYQVGKGRATFLDQIVASGSISYEFIIAVFEPDQDEPFLLVTSERDLPDLAMWAEMGIDPPDDGSHFLGVLDSEGHRNLGAANGWGDADIFEAEALRQIQQRVGARPKVIPS